MDWADQGNGLTDGLGECCLGVRLLRSDKGYIIRRSVAKSSALSGNRRGLLSGDSKVRYPLADG